MYTRFNFLVAAIFYLLICALDRENAEAQEGNIGLARYHFSHMRDTTESSIFIQEDFLLVFDQQQSLYTSQTRIDQRTAQAANIQQAMSSDAGYIDMGVMKLTTSEKIYGHDKEKELYTEKRFGRNKYLIKEPFPTVNWKIERQTKNILGYNCQKATGVCKGRLYTAWFSTDVPVNAGPWKLRGLPGLILEAYDVKERIRFTCTKLSLTNALPKGVSLKLPESAITANAADYKRMEKASQEGLDTGGDLTEDVQIDKTTLNGTTVNSARKKDVVNYPLELDK